MLSEFVFFCGQPKKGDRIPDNKLLLCCQECIELGGPNQWSPALGVMDILEHYDAHARMRMYLGAHHDKINRKSLIGKAYMPWRKEYEIKKHQLTKYLDDYRHPIYPQVKAALEEWISEILEE